MGSGGDRCLCKLPGWLSTKGHTGTSLFPSGLQNQWLICVVALGAAGRQTSCRSPAAKPCGEGATSPTACLKPVKCQVDAKGCSGQGQVGVSFRPLLETPVPLDSWCGRGAGTEMDHPSPASAKSGLHLPAQLHKSLHGGKPWGWPMPWVKAGTQELVLLGTIAAVLWLSPSSSVQAGGSFVWRKCVGWRLLWGFFFFF